MNNEQLYDEAAELYEEEKFAEAINLLEKAHNKDQEDVDVIVLLAGCYLKITHFTEVAKWLIVADKIETNNPVVKYNLGYALLCMGRLNDAMKNIKKCLRLNPDKEIKKLWQININNSSCNLGLM